MFLSFITFFGVFIEKLEAHGYMREIFFYINSRECAQDERNEGNNCDFCCSVCNFLKTISNKIEWYKPAGT